MHSVSIYAKCRLINNALGFFERMHVKDFVSYSVVVSGCVQNGYAEEALQLFRKMQVVGIEPELVTMIKLLPTCSYLAALQHTVFGHNYSNCSWIHSRCLDLQCCDQHELVAEGKHLFRAMTQEFNIVPKMDHYFCTVDLLGRVGFLNETHKLITTMPCEPDAPVWNALLVDCRIHINKRKKFLRRFKHWDLQAPQILLCSIEHGGGLAQWLSAELAIPEQLSCQATPLLSNPEQLQHQTTSHQNN
ncbi:pentatricopeptide repeat-containing protein [Salvia divinorum]|uniref:Pentatricopeptide repeat-containing protein n=1 Tax=Salvia divinorum TaxID=28513 RepID=A0ABD1I235_SALDI